METPTLMGTEKTRKQIDDTFASINEFHRDHMTVLQHRHIQLAPVRLTFVMAVARPLLPATGSFVTCTVKCLLSTSGHAPCALHVSTSPPNVLRCGSPNNAHSRWRACAPPGFRYAQTSARPCSGGGFRCSSGRKSSPRMLQLNRFI